MQVIISLSEKICDFPMAYVERCAAAAFLQDRTVSLFKDNQDSISAKICHQLKVKEHCRKFGFSGSRNFVFPYFFLTEIPMVAIQKLLDTHSIGTPSAIRGPRFRQKESLAPVGIEGLSLANIHASQVLQLFVDCVWDALPTTYKIADPPPPPRPMLSLLSIAQFYKNFTINQPNKKLTRRAIFAVFFPRNPKDQPPADQQGWKCLRYFSFYFSWLDAAGDAGSEALFQEFIKLECVPHCNTKDKLIKFQRGNITMLPMPIK